MLFWFLLVASLEICIGRALKVLASSRKVKQIIDLTARINRALAFEDNIMETSSRDDRQQKTADGNNENNNNCTTLLCLSISLCVCLSLAVCVFISVFVSVSLK